MIKIFVKTGPVYYLEVVDVDKFTASDNKVEYDDKNVKCINCEFYIPPDKIDFSKTKTNYRNDNKKEMSQVEFNALPTSINPHFLLKLFDKFHNLK